LQEVDPGWRGAMILSLGNLSSAFSVLVWQLGRMQYHALLKLPHIPEMSTSTTNEFTLSTHFVPIKGIEVRFDLEVRNKRASLLVQKVMTQSSYIWRAVLEFAGNVAWAIQLL
jgi:hypothetical protein